MEARAIPILDVRSPERFRASHLPDAVNIPLAALEERLHELPAPGPASPLLVVYSLEEEQQSGAAPQAHATLGNAAKYQCQFRDWEAEPAGDAVPGKQVRFLWSPNPALVHLWPRMQAHWDGQTQGLTALDLAAGNGRDAVLLARHGVSVWAIDYQERQLRKIEELQQFFRDEMREDIVQAMGAIHVSPLDLESSDRTEEILAWRGGPVDILVVSRYLHRPLFPSFARLIAPNGLLLFHTFMVGAESVGKKTPTKPRFLLSPGELAATFTALGFDVLVDEVILLPDGRPTSSFLARRRQDQ